MSLNVLCQNDRLVPVDVYKNGGTRRGKVVLSFGSYIMIVPKRYKVKEEEVIKTVQKLKYKPLGVRPYGLTYMYYRGVRYSVAIGQKDEMSDMYFKDENAYNRFIKNEALKYYEERVNYWAPIMGITVPLDVKVSTATKYVGQFTISKNIVRFSTNLLAYAPYIVDTIVIHELTHYFVFSHSKDFYNIVLKHCPNYRKVQKLVGLGNFTGDMK